MAYHDAEEVSVVLSSDGFTSKLRVRAVYTDSDDANEHLETLKESDDHHNAHVAIEEINPEEED